MGSDNTLLHVYAYRWTSAVPNDAAAAPTPPAAAPLADADARLAARLVQSCQTRAHTSYKAEPWRLQPALKAPAPGRSLYEFHPTLTASPRRYAGQGSGAVSSGGPQLAAPLSTRTTVDDREPFRHCRGPTHAETRSSRDCEPDARADGRGGPTPSALKGILRTSNVPASLVSTISPNDPPTSGPSSGAPADGVSGRIAPPDGLETRKRKKVVRVESPRTSEARRSGAHFVETETGGAEKATGRNEAVGVAAGAEAGKADRPLQSSRNADGDSIAPPSPQKRRRGRASSPDEAPSTKRPKRTRPDPNGADLPTAGRPDCGPPAPVAAPVLDPSIGAIQRCIPPPYAHPSLDPLLYPDLACELHPARQHPVPIRYLFPSAASALAAGEASPGKDRASTVLPPALRFPRRGAWIVPLCGALPIPHTSPAVWLSSPLDRARTPIPGGDSSSSGPPPIEWTDARLAALWTLLSTLHTKRSFGYIRAQAITSPAPFPPSPPSEEPPLGEPAEPVGDVIKINCDAHLALAFKGLLEQFTVAAARAVPARFRIGVGGPPAPLDKSAVESDGADGGGRAGRGARATMKGKGPQGTSAAADAAEVDDPARDREKWLKGRALVWLDEEGRAVLTA